MEAPKSPSLREFAAFVDGYPARMPLWRVGKHNLYPVLAWLNAHPVAEQRASVAVDGPHLTAMSMLRPHHNQVGISTAWAVRHLAGSDPEAELGEPDLRAAFELASRYWQIKNVLDEVRQGLRSFQSKGRSITVSYGGDAHLDVLDRLLDLFEDVTSMPEGPPAEVRSLTPWLADGGESLPWEAVPLLMKQEHRTLACRLVQSQPSYLDADLDVGGFTMGEATSVLIELFARASHAHACTLRGVNDPDVIVPARPRVNVVASLARDAAVASARTGRIVDLLTTNLDICGDPCLTPLVGLPDGRVVLMSSLIIPGASVRNFTARLQLEPNRFGEAGRKLGLLGSRTVAQTLRERLETGQVSERVDVYAGDGSRIGDLDVVAFEPSLSLVAVFEVLWNIGPDGSAEVGKSEARAHAKRAQVARLREAIDQGAIPNWPPGWSVPPDASYRWFILTPNVLPALPLDDQRIIVRSHQMLERFRWEGTSVADMVRALESPPPPPPGLVETDWVSLRYGPYQLRIEALLA